MKMIKPSTLRNGDLIGLCAPAGIVNENEIFQAIERIEKEGYRVLLGNHVFDSYRFFSSSLENRIHDLQSFLDNKDIKAIYCARGGFGTGKIVDYLDLTKFKKSPKWVIGFSDITVLHLSLMNEGFESIHGPVARQLIKKEMEISTQSIFETLASGNVEINWDTESTYKGEIEGRIFGGNLSMLVNSIGTSTDFNSEGKILFMEDVGEHIYRIDRMLNQMQRAGKFNGLKAILIGDFTDISETVPEYGISVYQLILEFFRDYDYPLVPGFPVGHGNKNLPVIQNSIARLSLSNGKARLQME